MPGFVKDANGSYQLFWLGCPTEPPILVSSVTESSMAFDELIDQKTDKFSPYMIAGQTTALTEHSNR